MHSSDGDSDPGMNRESRRPTAVDELKSVDNEKHFTDHKRKLKNREQLSTELQLYNKQLQEIADREKRTEDEMSESGDTSDDNITEWIGDINLSNEPASTSSSDKAVQPPENEVFHPILLQFFQAYLTRNQKNFWIVHLTTSFNDESYYEFKSFRSDASRHAAVSFVKWWPSYVEKQKYNNYKIESVKMFMIYTPCQKCLENLLKWLEEEDALKLSIHYAFLSKFWNKTGWQEQDYEIWKYLVNARAMFRTNRLIELNKIDTVSLADLVKDLGQPLHSRTRDIKVREAYLIYIPEVRLETETGFSHLVSSFFEACQYTKWPVTYWIIELSTASSSANDESDVTFAAVKNIRGKQGGSHAEIVFMTWWPFYVKKHPTCTSLRVFTNYSPCAECAPVLSKWLNDNQHMKMSIFYAFVYTAERFGTGAEYKAGWEQLRNAENLVELQDFDTSSLRDLAERVNYQDTAIEDIYVADHWLKWRKAEVNKRRIDRDA